MLEFGIIFSFITLIAYICGVLHGASFNPTRWPSKTRLIILLCWLLVLFAVWYGIMLTSVEHTV